MCERITSNYEKSFTSGVGNEAISVVFKQRPYIKGLAKKKGLVVCSPRTFFWIKLCSFEILKIGEKEDLSIQKRIQNHVKF